MCFLGMCAIFGVFSCVWGQKVFFWVCVFFGMFGCVFVGRKWVFECVQVCVWMCLCVECVIYVIFQVSVTIVYFQFCHPKIFRVNLVECVFAILLGKYLSNSNNVQKLIYQV